MALQVESWFILASSYQGNGGILDKLTYHNNRAFSTKDRDNDSYPSGNCAIPHKGGWWYGHCHQSSLNGNNYGFAKDNSVSMCWHKFGGASFESLKSIKMAIRSK